MKDTTDKQVQLSVISFNALGVPLLSKYKKERFNKIAEELNRRQADIICFQEVHTYALLFLLKRKLLGYPHIKYKRFFYGPRGGLVIFSKLPVENVEYIDFNKKGAIHNKSIVSTLSRKGILVCQLKYVPVYVLNTHLTANFDFDWSVDNRYMRYITAQLKQIQILLQTLSVFHLEIIIAGDFNIPKNSVYYHNFLKNTKVIDLFKHASSPTHREYWKGVQKAHRLDYIFLLKNNRPVKILHTEHLMDKKVVLENNIHSYLSDHIGLQANLSFSLDVSDIINSSLTA